MADIYKKISNNTQSNRPVNNMTSTQSQKVQEIIQNFITYFKSA